MAYTYNITATNKDNNSSKFLFVCHLLESVIGIFISTFFVAHLFSLSVDTFDYVKNVGIYYLLTYILFGVTYYLFSYVVDRTNRIGIYRIALVLRLLLVLTMIFWGQALAAVIPIASLLYGTSGGAYYASYNVLKQEMVSRKTMGSFATYAVIVGKVIEIITPITLGFIISSSSFVSAAIVIAILSLLVFIASFFIKSKKPVESRFDLKKFFQMLRGNEPISKQLKVLYITAFVYGFSTAVGVLINVCIMLEFNSALSLGTISSIISVVALVEIFLVNKYTNPGKRNWLYFISMALPIIGCLLFTVLPAMITVVVYNFLMAVASIVLKTEYDIFRNSNLKEAGLYDEIAEHHVVTELSMVISRILSFIVILLVGLLKSLVAFKIMLFVFSSTYSIMLLLLAYYEKRYIKNSR